MMRLLCRISVVALLTAPQSALACAQLTQHIWMCARDTPWETATWDQFGDGATLLMQQYILNFTEDFPGSDLRDDLTTLEEQYTTYDAFQQDIYDEDYPAPTVIRTDAVTLDITAAHRVVQRGIWMGTPYIEAATLAEVGAHRILLQLQAPDETPLADLDRQTEAVLSFLHDTCADPVSCADDYEWPPAAPLSEQ